MFDLIIFDSNSGLFLKEKAESEIDLDDKVKKLQTLFGEKVIIDIMPAIEMDTLLNLDIPVIIEDI